MNFVYHQLNTYSLKQASSHHHGQNEQAEDGSVNERNLVRMKTSSLKFLQGCLKQLHSEATYRLFLLSSI